MRHAPTICRSSPTVSRSRSRSGQPTMTDWPPVWPAGMKRLLAAFSRARGWRTSCRSASPATVTEPPSGEPMSERPKSLPRSRSRPPGFDREQTSPTVLNRAERRSRLSLPAILAGRNALLPHIRSARYRPHECQSSTEEIQSVPGRRCRWGQDVGQIDDAARQLELGESPRPGRVDSK